MLGSSSWLRTSPFHGEGHGFESRTEYPWTINCGVEQLVGSLDCKSSPYGMAVRVRPPQQKHDENRIKSSCYYDTNYTVRVRA